MNGHAMDESTHAAMQNYKAFIREQVWEKKFIQSSKNPGPLAVQGYLVLKSLAKKTLTLKMIWYSNPPFGIKNKSSMRLASPLLGCCILYIFDYWSGSLYKYVYPRSSPIYPHNSLESHLKLIPEFRACIRGRGFCWLSQNIYPCDEHQMKQILKSYILVGPGRKDEAVYWS